MSLRQVGTPDWVYRWRLEAEHAMRASGRPGMTDKQARPVAALCYGLQIYVPLARSRWSDVLGDAVLLMCSVGTSPISEQALQW